MHSCQMAKVQQHATAPLEHRQLSGHHFQNIMSKLLDHLQSHKVKSSSRSSITTAISMVDGTAVTCAQALLSPHITQFGVPTDISSYRGPKFTSNLWTALNNLLGTQLHRITAYHPQANGIVERLHRQLKVALQACPTGPDWMDELPLVLLGLCSLPKEDLRFVPSELICGTNISLPGEYLEIPRHLLSQVCLTYLSTTIAGTSHHDRSMCLLDWRTVHLCLSFTMPIIHLCSALTLPSAWEKSEILHPGLSWQVGHSICRSP